MSNNEKPDDNQQKIISNQNNNNKPSEYAELSLNGKTIKLPVLEPTIGNKTINIQNLAKELNVFSYDPGFVSTASCDSSITYIDGEKGQLFYRGYDIDTIARNTSFIEVCFLLLKGELPNRNQYLKFNNIITQHTMLHEQLHRFYSGFRRDAHPMAIIMGVIGALSSFYHDSTDIRDPKQRMIASHRIIAKIPTIIAMAYKYSIGQPFIYPNNALDYASNFLNMCFSVPTEPYHINPKISRALDRIFILHADHEQNASTSTVRLASSSDANPFASIAAGIACLWGPAHGGANEACLNMLKEIGSEENIPQAIQRAKDPNDKFRLVGFGHRVYKNFDPRAKIMQETAHEVLEFTGVEDNIFKVAKKLEK